MSSNQKSCFTQALFPKTVLTLIVDKNTMLVELCTRKPYNKGSVLARKKKEMSLSVRL